MYYKMNVAGVTRYLPICPVTDKLYIAGFVIFGDQELTVSCARELLKRAPEYDYIITAEAKGIPLAHEMARQAGNSKYILARKGPKLYMRDIFSVTVNSITTAKEQHLYLDGADAELMRGKKILLVDEIDADTSRFWDARTHEPMDIDRFRRDLGNVEQAYQDLLHRMMGDNE